MQVVRKIENNVTILDVEGVVKLGESARAFSTSLDQVLREDFGPILINFEAVEYMDSTGLGELIGYLQKFNQGGRSLALVKPSHRILSLLKLTRLDAVFNIFQSTSEAMAFLTGGNDSQPQS
ncbi:MAG: STAS domain-containing protein [Acidobacteriota bacterium]